MNLIQPVENVGNPSITEYPTHETILDELKKFNEWDINSLINIIVNHYHSNTRKNIIGIYDLAQKVSGKHSERHPELPKLVAALFLFFDDLLFQLKKEEQILFPNIIQLMEKRAWAGSATYTTFGIIEDSALLMQNEHQAAVKELKFLRRLTNNYLIPADACISYKYLFTRMKEFETDLMLHIVLKDNILFPKAIRMDSEMKEE